MFKDEMALYRSLVFTFSTISMNWENKDTREVDILLIQHCLNTVLPDSRQKQAAPQKTESLPAWTFLWEEIWINQ